MKQQSQSNCMTFRRLTFATTSAAILALVVLVICGSQQVEAGCSRFGHSCFGAHGKRGGNDGFGFEVPTGRFYGGESPVEQRRTDGNYYPPVSFNSIPNYPSGANLSPYFYDWLISGRAGAAGAPSHAGIQHEDELLGIKSGHSSSSSSDSQSSE